MTRQRPQGDDTRQWGPPFVTRDDDASASYFHPRNRGKTSVVIDFRTAEGKQDLLNRSRGRYFDRKLQGRRLAKYGLDYETLSHVNPALIYCSITGFGQTGPYAHRAGYDYIIQGMSGFMSITGEPDGAPQRAGVAITDLFTGVYATTAILSALHMRAKTGQGQHIDMSLLDTAVSVMANQGMNYLTTGTPPARTGNYHPNLTPYQVFECCDGHIIIATGNDAQYRRLCQILDLKHMTEAPEYLKNADRVANREQMIDALMDKTRQWSKLDLLSACEREGVPAGPINNMQEVFDDPQIQHRGLQIDFDGIPSVRSPFRFSNASLKLDRPSPKLGEN